MNSKSVYIDGKTVFLAGATGLVGSGILTRILSQYPNARVRAAYMNTEPFIKDERIEYIKVDLRNAAEVRNAVRGADCAIMAAAYTAGAAIIKKEPWKYLDFNTIMNLNMLEAFYFEGVKRVVFISTASLYQEFEGSIKEDELDLNLDPHPSFMSVGWMARFIEKSAAFWHQGYGMEVLIARASNVFGPYAAFHPERSNFIPALIRKAVDKMDPFEIWGSPDVVRDVIYVGDFADAIVTMLASTEIKFDIFNIGSGTRTTVGDVAQWAMRFAGHKPSEVKYIVEGPTTITRRELDCTKAREVLGWVPKGTVEEGVKRTTLWWMENKDRWMK